MISPEALDQLLDLAVEGFGLAVISNNPHRLQVALQSRMRHHRSVHPEAYTGLSLIQSKSPRELYIVNRAKAVGAAGRQEATERPDLRGDAPLAVLDLSQTGTGHNPDQSAPSGAPEENG